MQIENMQIANIEVHQRTLPTSWKRRDNQEYDRAPRVYVSPEGETILENLMSGRHTRPHTLYKRLAGQAALNALGLDNSTHTLSWSTRAGCSCPCSPGFIVKKRGGGKVNVRADVWVTVKG